MIDDAKSSADEPDDEIEIEWYDVISGEAPDEYFVLSTWNYGGGDVADIKSGFVEVKSSAKQLSWKMIYSLDTWVQSIYRFKPECYMLGAVNGGLIKIRKGKRETFNTGHIGGIGAIWGVSDKDCWLGHNEGLSHWDGQRVSRDIKTDWISKIRSLNSNFALAAGANGVVMQFDGKDWKKIESVPTNKRFTGICCVSEREIYFSGWGGALYRWDGGSFWERIEVLDDGKLLDKPIYNPILFMGSIYVGAGAYGLFKINGRKATKIRDVFCSRTAVIDGKLILTGSASLVEFDGNDWRDITITPAQS